MPRVIPMRSMEKLLRQAVLQRVPSSLRQRDFALFWSGQTASLIGDGVYTIVLALQDVAPKQPRCHLVLRTRRSDRAGRHCHALRRNCRRSASPPSPGTGRRLRPRLRGSRNCRSGWNPRTQCHRAHRDLRRRRTRRCILLPRVYRDRPGTPALRAARTGQRLQQRQSGAGRAACGTRARWVADRWGRRHRCLRRRRGDFHDQRCLPRCDAAAFPSDPKWCPNGRRHARRTALGASVSPGCGGGSLLWGWPTSPPSAP